MDARRHPPILRPKLTRVLQQLTLNMLFLAFRRDHIAAESALSEKGGGRGERGEEKGGGRGEEREGRRREKGGGRGEEREGRRERGEETESRKGIEQREGMVGREKKSSVIPHTSSRTDCFIPSVIHLFCSTATIVEGGLSRSLKASRRTKSIAMSYTFIHTT